MIAVNIFIVLVVCTAVGAGIVALGHRRQAALASRVQTLGADRDIYRVTRRMAHVLESLLIQDSNFPVLSDTTRSTITDVLDEWEKLL